MGWKTSSPHGPTDSEPRIGRHVDVYHTNAAGKRDESHSRDMKIDYDERKPTTNDIRTDIPRTVDLRRK